MNTDHSTKLHDTPDEYLAEAMPIAKKIATALGAENYNILQVRASDILTVSQLQLSLINRLLPIEQRSYSTPGTFRPSCLLITSC